MDPMIGRMCKRIIDYCRSVFIEKQINTILEKKGSNQHFKAELVYYCNAECHTQSLIAKRSHGSLLFI